MKHFFLASEVRSGSTYASELCAYSLKESHGLEIWDLSKEHFSHLHDGSRATDVRDVLNQLWTDPHGYRSSKLMCAELSIICRESDTAADINEIFFGSEAYWIVVRRRDLLSQAISLAFARKDGIFHAYESSVEHARAEDLQEADVEAALRALSLSDVYLDVFSRRPQNCISWYYEDIESNPKEFLEIIIQFLGLVSVNNVNIANIKISRTASMEKDVVKENFSSWFLKNFHATD